MSVHPLPSTILVTFLRHLNVTKRWLLPSCIVALRFEQQLIVANSLSAISSSNDSVFWPTVAVPSLTIFCTSFTMFLHFSHKFSPLLSFSFFSLTYLFLTLRLGAFRMLLFVLGSSPSSSFSLSSPTLSSCGTNSDRVRLLVVGGVLALSSRLF